MRRLKVCYDYRVVFICLFVGKFHTNLLLITFQLVKFVYCNASIRYLSSGEIYCFGAVPVESLNFSGVPKTLSCVCVCVCRCEYMIPNTSKHSSLTTQLLKSRFPLTQFIIMNCIYVYI